MDVTDLLGEAVLISAGLACCATPWPWLQPEKATSGGFWLDTGSPRERPMTALANLTARKQRLLERLQGRPGQHERDEIDRLVKQIDVALDLLGATAPVQSHDER